MLLRSSSTPVLGSLISSISDQSPNHHHFQPELANKHQPTTTVPQCLNKFPFNQGGSQSLTFSCNSSPISPSVSELSFGRCSSSGFRRAQSEGNLEGLANASGDIDEFFFFDNAGLYALQLSICSNNSRGEPESNPGAPGQQRINPPLGYPIVLILILI